MTRRTASVLAAAMLALTLSACTSMTMMMGNKLDKVADELKTALAGEPVDVTKHDGSVVITSSADYMYPSGGWQLKPDAPVLSKMVPTLSKLHNTKILISGYTDNTPVGPQLQSMGISNNTDLSVQAGDDCGGVFAVAWRGSQRFVRRGSRRDASGCVQRYAGGACEEPADRDHSDRGRHIRAQ